MVRVSIYTGKLLVVMCPSATRDGVNGCNSAANVSGWTWQAALLRRKHRRLAARYNLRDIRRITLAMGETTNLVETAHQPEAQRKKSTYLKPQMETSLWLREHVCGCGRSGGSNVRGCEAAVNGCLLRHESKKTRQHMPLKMSSVSL
jgi:hypothetical protein